MNLLSAVFLVCALSQNLEAKSLEASDTTEFSVVSSPVSQLVRRRRAEARLFTGGHCEYIKLCDIAALDQCQDGTKFVIKQESGTRKQFLILNSSPILAFVRNGVKFTACSSFTEVTLSIDCKAVEGLGSVDLAATAPAGPTVRGCQCGVRNEARILGGQDAQAGAHPWIVGISRAGRGGFFCGGSLVAREWVLTAAHCLENERVAKLRVTLGELNTAEKGETPHREVFSISEAIVHEDFDFETFNNDIALLRVSRDVSLHSHTPVCLPSLGSFKALENMEVVVAGWGKTSEKGGTSPDHLQEVTLKTVSNEICEAGFKTAGFPDYEVTEKMVCAGGEKGRDGCQGDSGGPLVAPGREGAITLMGVTSWGEGCGREGLYGVYTKVSSLLPWVESQMEAYGGATFCEL